MIYHKPTYKKEKVTGFEEGYKFKDVKSVNLTIETNVGGWENFEVSKDDRIIYILDGLGFAKIQGKSLRLEEGKVLEIPAGQEVEMNGQLRFICVTSKL